ncbi:response regulator [Frigoriglobus tundricola]|uniref:Response regulatory domain-containing protein n=1 Tax=Frigoriglobus tundricola TaxID=2774151 RepID=A0A6M5YNX5_9BACT|nr:response regulator [Frigoriglobus tundricola]QJW94983.1 hypothetical protein FTUN_2509 [Frigoriglobus tundricola]
MVPLLAPAPVKLWSALARPTVLLADSDAGALEWMRRFLRHRGYTVATASGGVECLAQLRRCSAPVLVLDAGLAWGGADGVLAVLREDPALAHAPVILTSSAPERDAIRFGHAPVVCVLEKPVLPDDLLERIRMTERLVIWTRAGGQPRRTRTEPEDRP